MPKYYEDKEEDGRACAGVREDFKACLLQHDCVVKVTSALFVTMHSNIDLCHDFVYFAHHMDLSFYDGDTMI